MWLKVPAVAGNIKPTHRVVKHFQFPRVKVGCLCARKTLMKKSTIIASHVAIFALGVSAAFIVAKDSNQSDANPDVAGGGSRMSRDGFLPDGREVGKRERRDGENRATGRDGSSSPRESLGKINRITDAYERQRALMDFYDTLAPEQFAAVADEFQELYHYGNTGTEMELLFQAWAKADPTAALDYIDENPDMRRNRGEVLETWAANDAAGAEKWALDRHDGDGANPYMASVIRGIAAYDLPNASRLTAEMPVSRERGQAIDAMAKALLMSGTEAALAFPDTIEDEHLKGSFVLMISQNLSRKDPQAAADWVAAMDGTFQERAAGNIAGRLAGVDVDKAEEFVNSLQPVAKANAAVATIPEMSREDIAGTARWVSTMAGTPGYDKVVESFVWSCDERAPEQSAAWIRGVADTNQQTKLYHRMLGNWARRDKDAVRSWVAENEVPDNVRKRFSR